MLDLPVDVVGVDIMKSILIKSPAVMSTKLNSPADQNKSYTGHLS